MPERTDDPFTRLAALLATMPDLTDRLLREHNPSGTCAGCTIPGRRPVAAPCSIRSLAELAVELRR